MATNLDGPIRANRFADSRELPDSRESLQGSRTEPLCCESRFGGLKIANRSFEAIPANRWHAMKIGGLLRIDFAIWLRLRLKDAAISNAAI